LVRLKPGFRIGSSFQARFDDQGSRLAAIGRGRRGALWDVARRAKIGFFPQLKHTSSISFSPDGSLLACKNTYGDILVVDVATLTEHTHVPGKAYGEGADVHFSPCGRYLLDGSWQGHLLVREVRSGAVVWEEFVEGTTVSELTCCRNRQVWAYTRTVGGRSRKSLSERGLSATTSRGPSLASWPHFGPLPSARTATSSPLRTPPWR
jgi:hypothetical protein